MELKKRNKDKFSLNSYFQISNEEYYLICSRCQNSSSRSQSATLNNQKNNRGSNLKYLPYLFTKDSIYTLSTILKSESSREIALDILTMFDEENEYQIILKSPEIQDENVRTMIYELNGMPIKMSLI